MSDSTVQISGLFTFLFHVQGKNERRKGGGREWERQGRRKKEREREKKRKKKESLICFGNYLNPLSKLNSRFQTFNCFYLLLSTFIEPAASSLTCIQSFPVRNKSAFKCLTLSPEDGGRTEENQHRRCEPPPEAGETLHTHLWNLGVFLLVFHPRSRVIR